MNKVIIPLLASVMLCGCATTEVTQADIETAIEKIKVAVEAAKEIQAVLEESKTEIDAIDGMAEARMEEASGGVEE